MASPDSPAAYLARASARSRKEALSQVFETEPSAVLQTPFDDDHVLFGLEFLLFPANEKMPGNHLVTHGLTQAHLRAPSTGLTVDDRFSGLGMELCIRFDCAEEAVLDAASLRFAELLLEIVDALVVDEPFQTLLPGDVLEMEELEDESNSWLVVDGAPFRNRLVLPTGHCHLVQLVRFEKAEIDATAHLSAEQRFELAEKSVVERDVLAPRALFIDQPGFADAMERIED